MHLSKFNKVPKYYVYCLICLGSFVIQGLKFLTLKEYGKAVIFLAGAAIAFGDAYSIRWKLDDED